MGNEVLILEDNLIAGRTLERIFSSRGVKAVWAKTIQEGEESFISNPNVLFIYVDGQMPLGPTNPNMGITIPFVKKIKHAGFKGIVFACSVNDTSALLKAGSDYGCPKPIDMNLFWRAFEEAQRKAGKS